MFGRKCSTPDAQDSADFLEFLGLAGLGQAEARSLTRADVDLDAGRISHLGTKHLPALRSRSSRNCSH